jgi:hypothetical protein
MNSWPTPHSIQVGITEQPTAMPRNSSVRPYLSSLACNWLCGIVTLPLPVRARSGRSMPTYSGAHCVAEQTRCPQRSEEKGSSRPLTNLTSCASSHYLTLREKRGRILNLEFSRTPNLIECAKFYAEACFCNFYADLAIKQDGSSMHLSSK